MLLKGWEPTNWLFDFCILFIKNITICLEGHPIVLFLLQTEAVSCFDIQRLMCKIQQLWLVTI